MKTALLLTAAAAAVFAPCLATGQTGPAPFAHGSKITVAQAMAQAPKLDKSLVPMEKAFDAAGQKLHKKPKDAAAKKAYVAAGYKYGHALMMDRGMKNPPVQYRAALGVYRRVLAVDPHDSQTLDEKNTIEKIYKSMRMPIPQ